MKNKITYMLMGLPILLLGSISPPHPVLLNPLQPILQTNTSNPPSSNAPSPEQSPPSTQTHDTDQSISSQSPDTPTQNSTPPSPAQNPTQPNQNTAGVFSTGAVTLRFDDGWQSQYDSALPIMNQAGYKGTFYIVTHQISDNGFSGFMSRDEITHLKQAGEEIGAHTQTHPHLTTLSSGDQEKEIVGSKSDLENWNVGPVTSFSYPYGEYASSTVQIVQKSAFTNAVTAIDSDVTPQSSLYELESKTPDASTTVADLEQWVDTAVSKKEWLILSFHRIDTSGDEYSITPENFKMLIEYLKNKNVKVVTVSEGVAQM